MNLDDMDNDLSTASLAQNQTLRRMDRLSAWSATQRRFSSRSVSINPIARLGLTRVVLGAPLTGAAGQSCVRESSGRSYRPVGALVRPM